MRVTASTARGSLYLRLHVTIAYGVGAPWTLNWTERVNARLVLRRNG